MLYYILEYFTIIADRWNYEYIKSYRRVFLRRQKRRGKPRHIIEEFIRGTRGQRRQPDGKHRKPYGQRRQPDGKYRQRRQPDGKFGQPRRNQPRKDQLQFRYYVP